jgi:general secretion pathway protein G
MRGVSLVELMAALALVAILGAIAVPAYSAYVNRARTSTAIADISEIETRIQRYQLDNVGLPPDLAAIGLGGKLDPWKHPYAYLAFDGLVGKGQMRKDKNLVPINSDYDLYSKGPDGDSAAPLTAKKSRDDIVRANDGRFVGRAEDY